MHQTQWVRAHAASLDAALAAFTAHVEARGHRNNWWKWTLARLSSGEVIARTLEPYETRDLDADELAARAEAVARAKLELRDPARWAASAWVEVWAQLGLDALSPVRLGGASERERAAIDSVLATPPADFTRRFLETTLRAQRDSYARFSLDARGPETTIESPLRAARAIALERVHQVTLLEYEASALPFLRNEAPDDWPAHLLGAGSAPAILLAVDMHL